MNILPNKSYTGYQVRTIVANEIASALAAPTYESQVCDAVKKLLQGRGVQFTGDVEKDVQIVTSALA